MSADNNTPEKNLQVTPGAEVSNNETQKDSTIYFGLSKVPPGDKKSVSTGFDMVEAKTLRGIALMWQHYSISSAVFSSMIRWDKYKGKWISDNRRRNHNISFIGNTFIYDFDDGKISMDDFAIKYNGKFKFLVTKSKNDHKYDYDRFKVMVVHDTIFVQNTKTDAAPEGYDIKNINQYQDSYIGFAEHFKFWEYADKSTIDLCRLASNIGKGFIVCQTLN